MSVNKYAKLAKQSQKLRKKQKMCSDKKAFDTAESAVQKGQRVYKCPHCSKYHRSGQFDQFANTIVSK